MLSSTFANGLSFSVFQKDSHPEAKFLLNHFQGSIDYTEMRVAT